MIQKVRGLTDDQHVATAHGALVRMSQLIDKTVDAAAQVIDNQHQQQLAQDDIPPLMLMRHTATHALGISSLVRIGLSEPTLTMLRSMMESALSLKYMLTDDRVRRAQCYWVCHWRNALSAMEQHDPDKESGNHWQAIAKNDIFLGSMESTADLGELRRAVDSKKGLLADHPYLDIDTEWKQYFKKHNRPPHWYTLDGGPRSLRQLAKSVGAEATYLSLYGQFSARVHAADSTEGLGVENGRAFVKHFYHPEGIENAVTMCVSLLLHAARVYITVFGNQRDQTKFLYHYLAHIRDDHRALAGKRVIKMRYGTN